jgi:glycine oxidase
MPDVLILGGGVIGLSLAYELAGQGAKVRILDRGQLGAETSWAGAGILPPSKFRTKAEPIEWLRGYSSQLHAQWAAQLKEETGIDNGFRRSGGVHLADSRDAAAELLQQCERWRRESLYVKWLHAADLDREEPAIAGAYERCQLHGAALAADEVQIRSPRHLKALIAACQRRGVELSAGIEAFDFDIAHQKITAVKTTAGRIMADQFVLSAGAWSQGIAARLGINMPVKPMRGQIVLLSTGRPILQRIVEWNIEVNHRYLLPREDGRLLVGTTMEDVGFDRRNTAAGVADILQFATRLAPALQSATVERSWCGFRPASVDGMPYLGAVPGLENAFVAAGHFRHGLWLSTGTAVVMSRLLRGESPGVDLTPFRVDRAAAANTSRMTTLA